MPTPWPPNFHPTHTNDTVALIGVPPEQTSSPGKTISDCLCACPSFLGGALTAGSVGVPMFLAFRFLAGFGIGVLLVLFPIYAAGLSPPHSRGLLSCGLAWRRFVYWVQPGRPSVSGPVLPRTVALRGGSRWRSTACLHRSCSSFRLRCPRARARWVSKTDWARPAITYRVHSIPGENNDFARAESKAIVAQIRFELVKSSGAVKDVCRPVEVRIQENVVPSPCGPRFPFDVWHAGHGLDRHYQLPDHFVTRDSVWAPRSPLPCTGCLSVSPFAQIRHSSLIVGRQGRRRSVLIGLSGCLVALIGETVASS
jgi:hypothetical protein